MANYDFGSPIAGYTESTVNNTLNRIPKDTVRYRIVHDYQDNFYIWLSTIEYYTDSLGEHDRWVYDYYTSWYHRDHYTIHVDVVHNVTRHYYKKRYVDIESATYDNRFYDPSLEEKLGGEVMTLGGI